jgi:hypothetical protein
MTRIGIWTNPAARLLLAVLVLVPQVALPQGGDPLGPEFRINTYTPEGQYRALVAAAPSGDFVVVWTSEQYVRRQRTGR